MDTTLADNIMGLGREFEIWLDGDPEIAVVLIACLGIAVGFVGYKLIKRAINKA